MKIVETTFERLPRERLEIGFEGENLRATVRIDCASVFAEYPNATPALIVKPLFADAYPVVVDRNGTDVDWLITSEILSFNGDGEIQLIFYKDQVICKSAVSKIRVSRSLTVTGKMPDPVVQWIENANRKLAEVDAQITELEGMVDTATDAATRAEQSASTASTKAEQAAGSAATATEKATEATNAAGTATAKAAEAQTAAQTATAKATSAAESERIATAKAVEATTAAGTATTKAEQATEAAQTATEKARDASASATAAHASEINAAESADGAFSAEVGANAAKRAAETSATQAGISEQNAGIAAQTATQKAAEATQSATNAAIFAGTATTKAEEAAESAQAASDAQTAVEQTAEQFADSLEQIEQNKQDIAELDERKANIDGYYPDMTVGNAEQLNSSKYVENSEPYTLRTSGGTSDIGNREYVDAVVGGTLAWNQAVRDEASENSTDFADVVTVTDAVEDAAGVKVKLEPVQDLHGYDNPWPAGGGKNLLNITGTSQSINGVNFTVNSDGTIDVSGTATGAVSFEIESATDKYNGLELKLNGSVSGVGLWVYDGSTRIAIANADSDAAFTGAETIRIVAFIYSGTSVNGKLKPMIRLASETDATFAPYSNICPITGWDGVQIVVSPTTDAEDGQTYDITLPSEAGTVYGGELNVNEDGSGVLTVTKAYGTISYSQGISNRENVGHFWYITTQTLQMPAPKGTNEGFICDRIAKSNITTESSPDNSITLYDNGFIRWKEPSSAVPSEYNAYLAENPIHFVYDIAQPITYTLTASQIRTLLGTNNVWSDAGQVALTYTGTDEHLTLESGKKYLARLSGTDSMLLGSGQEITAAKGTDNVFDLTKMFGTAVADYVYGQGAAFFRKWFPNAVYPYNAGELKHVEGLQSHDMVGFNLWDEEWEVGTINTSTGIPSPNNSHFRSKNYIPVFGGSAYYIHVSSDTVFFLQYDAQKNYISYFRSGLQTLDPNARYALFVDTTRSAYDKIGHPICISLAHNNSRNGEYEPYEKHSYPLDSTVVLRGIPKVDANGVYWDGDRYLPDGTVERKYGVLVCDGTISYNTPSIVGNYSRVQVNFTNGAGKLIYPQAVASWLDRIVNYSLESNHFYCNDMGAVIIVDTSLIGSTAESVRAFFAAHPLEIVYELATPTTETAQPYHSTQWVSDWGTEEFVSTGIIPVGTETRYPANLRDKLQHLPDAASGNGSYLIQQTDGQMVLTPFPAPPSTAGNYVLKATVTGGVATYTWEVAT